MRTWSLIVSIALSVLNGVCAVRADNLVGEILYIASATVWGIVAGLEIGEFKK